MSAKDAVRPRSGLKKAGDYIAAEFKKAGLKPGNPDGTYFQNFTINGAVKQGQAGHARCSRARRTRDRTR